MMQTIVFFGASERGRQVLRTWPSDWPVAYFVDNDPSKWGTVVDGIPVRDPRVVESATPGSVFVVITSLWSAAIAEQLDRMGLVAGCSYTTFDGDVGVLRRQRPIDAARGDLVAMVVEDHWFGVDYDRLRELCADAGIRYVPARMARHRANAPVMFDASTYRSMTRHGVPLFDACLLDVCVACGVTLDRLDPSNPAHWSVIVDHMQCAAALADAAHGALDDARPDAVVIPLGYTTIASVYRYLAVLRGIRVLALENSFNNARLVWDDLAGIAVNRIPARNYYWRWSDLVGVDVAAAHVRAYLSSVKADKRDDHRSPQTPWTGAAVPGRIVLYLANVLTDSSVLFNSRVGSQVNAIKAAARWALDHDCTFVLKIHPRERPGSPVLQRPLPPAVYSYEGQTVQALREDAAFWTRLTSSDRCVIDMDNRFDTYGLIRRSDVCVTVCSQSGLEALMMGKEAVLLGDAYYGGLGFTHDVHQIDQLGPALHAALSPAGRRADPVKVAKFFYIFDQVYCAEKSTGGVADLIRRTLGRARLPVLPATA